MTPNTESQAPAARAVIRRHRGPSAVWILPLLAALIAGWLIYRSYQEAGVMIEVVFDSAEGLEENKTRIVYKGLPSGTVKSLRLNGDLKSVTASIEIAPHAEPLLHEDTLFWLVKPQISLSGVRGLETLVSGYYIGIQPGKGSPAWHFVAQTEPPPPSREEAGLYITLFADSVNSLHQGSPVYFRDITVGEILDYKLDPNGDKILVDLFIQPQYSHLVRKHSRFWRASSLEVKGKLPEINVRLGSLATIIAGGIQFYTPPPLENPAAEEGDQFRLYSDYEAAEDGIEVLLSFPGSARISVGTEVMSQGVPVGRVREVTLSDDLQQLQARLLIDPRARPLLRAGSRFWLAAAAVDVADLSLGNLLRGSHIELAPGAGVETLSFQALDQAPVLSSDGFPIRLLADELGSLKRGSPLLYRQIKIGEVSGFELTGDGRQVQIYAQIEAPYRKLVTSATRFWDSSGVSARASLREGVQLRTESLTALAGGGIALMTDPGGKAIGRNAQFTLYASQQASLEQAQQIDILFAPGAPVAAGAPIRFRGQQVGRIDSIAISAADGSRQARASLFNEATFIARRGAQFWISESKIRLSGVENPENLLFGNHVEVLPGNGEAMQTFVALRKAPAYRPAPGLTLELHTDNLGSIATGSPVLYRGVPVGEVSGYELTLDGTGVRVYAHVDQAHATLVRNNSRFYNVTGIHTRAGLFSGLSIDVSSLETLVGGGIEFTTAELQAAAAEERQVFTLYPQREIAPPGEAQ